MIINYFDYLTKILLVLGLMFLSGGGLIHTADVHAEESKDGSLKVIIEPQGAVRAEAKWRVNQGEWMESGRVLSGLERGSYELEFKKIQGWIKPPNAKITIAQGENSETTSEYFAQPGSLMITITPEEVRQAGARWRVNQGQWKESKAFKELHAGEYLVEFNEVPEWDKPDSVKIVVEPGFVSSRSFNYGLKGQTGSLKVVLQPREAGEAGKWRITGSSQWHDSGHVQKNIEPGSYLIEFRPVSGWQRPEDTVSEIQAGQETGLEAEYHNITWGCISVSIEPGKALDAGAMWSYTGAEGRFFQGGHVECGLQAGGHEVLFKDMEGWTPPDSIQVEVYPDQVSTAAGRYHWE